MSRVDFACTAFHLLCLQVAEAGPPDDRGGSLTDFIVPTLPQLLLFAFLDWLLQVVHQSSIFIYNLAIVHCIFSFS